MIRTENQKQMSELIIQALSDESINLAEPMSDFEIQVFSATIDRLVSEETLPELSELIIEPRRMISLLQTKNLPEETSQQARKTLRRFRELIINLSSEPEVRVVN